MPFQSPSFCFLSYGSDSVVVDVSVSFCPPVMRVHVSPAGFDVQGSVEVFFGVLFFVEFASDSQKPVGSCGVGPGFVSVQVVVQVSSADGAIEAGLGDASVFPQAALEFAVEDEVSCRVQEVCQGQPAFVDGFCSGDDFGFSCFDEVDAVSVNAIDAGAVPFYFVEGLEGSFFADGDLSFFVFDVFCRQAGICFVFDDFVAWDKRTVGVGYGFLSSVEVDSAVTETGRFFFCQDDDRVTGTKRQPRQIEVDAVEVSDVLRTPFKISDVQGVVVLSCGCRIASVEPGFGDVDFACLSVFAVEVDGVAGDGSVIAVACIGFSCNLPSVEVDGVAGDGSAGRLASAYSAGNAASVYGDGVGFGVPAAVAVTTIDGFAYSSI